MTFGQDTDIPMDQRETVSGNADASRQDTETQRPVVQEEEQEGATGSQSLPRGESQPTPQTTLPAAPSPGPPSSGHESSSLKSSRSSRPQERQERQERTPANPNRRLDPPITKSTLSDLDVTKIIQNSKLRHDINFDPDLHFRPNVLGDRGKTKQERSNAFWRTLREQLHMFVDETKRPEFLAQFGGSDQWCLPVLLKTVKEILETLVPQRDREFLDEGLNVELLMQQFFRGVLDLEKLAEWLANVLKSHCAPMRDEEVNSMFNLIRDGNRDGDLHKLVLGMRELLSVLEHMKLDVANHQIRCLRPVLIQETIHYEQRSFCKKIESGRMSIDHAKEWYKGARRAYDGIPTRGFGDMSVLFEALSRLVLPSTPLNNLPETFAHDHDRLLKMRSDILDAVNLNICMRLYDDLEVVARSTSQRSMARDDVSSAFSRTSSRTSSRTLSADYSQAFGGSRPSSYHGSAGSPAPSPRSSYGYVPAYVATDPHEAKVKSRNLYNSLVALLHTAPHVADQPKRWAFIAPSMAVEIFRYVNNTNCPLAEVENRLLSTICKVDSDLFGGAEQDFLTRLIEELSNRVGEFKGLSGVSLYAAASEKRIPPGSNTTRDFYECLRDGPEGGVNDVAMRLAHVGILHWRVWAGLAYLEDC